MLHLQPFLSSPDVVLLDVCRDPRRGRGGQGYLRQRALVKPVDRRRTQRRTIKPGTGISTSTGAEAAQDAACRQDPERADPGAEHERDCGHPAIRRSVHETPGDDEPDRQVSETPAHDRLPWRIAEPIP